jgi:hypothetical protein
MKNIRTERAKIIKAKLIDKKMKKYMHATLSTIKKI